MPRRVRGVIGSIRGLVGGSGSGGERLRRAAAATTTASASARRSHGRGGARDLNAYAYESDGSEMRIGLPLAQEELAQLDERLVVTAGVPFGTPGATNILRITRV